MLILILFNQALIIYNGIKFKNPRSMPLCTIDFEVLL